MTVQAYIYYCPALLIFSMSDNADTAASGPMDDLTPPAKHKNGKNPLEYYDDTTDQRVALLSVEQKRAVAMVVRYYCEDELPFDDRCEPCLNYWDRWL